MDIKTKPVAVMCFSSGTGGMERSAVRLADMLSSVSEVVLLCKRGSFTEKLYQQGNYSFKCEPIKFSSRLFSPAMLFGVRAAIDTHDIYNVIFFGASELKTLYFAFMAKTLNVTVWHGTTKADQRGMLFITLYIPVLTIMSLSRNTWIEMSGRLCRQVVRLIIRL